MCTGISRSRGHKQDTNRQTQQRVKKKQKKKKEEREGSCWHTTRFCWHQEKLGQSLAELCLVHLPKAEAGNAVGLYEVLKVVM